MEILSRIKSGIIINNIEKINNKKAGEYEKDYMKSKFDS